LKLIVAERFKSRSKVMFRGWRFKESREALNFFLVFAVVPGNFFNVDLTNKSKAQTAFSSTAPGSRYL
jgi:hypothetical protein